MNCCNSGLIMGEKGRCVKTDGLIGKRLVKKQSSKINTECFKKKK